MWIAHSIVSNTLGMLEDFVRPCGQFPQVIRPESLITSSFALIQRLNTYLSDWLIAQENIPIAECPRRCPF